MHRRMEVNSANVPEEKPLYGITGEHKQGESSKAIHVYTSEDDVHAVSGRSSSGS